MTILKWTMTVRFRVSRIAAIVSLAANTSAFLVLVPSVALGQIERENLIAGMKQVEVTSVITIGDMGSTSTYNAPYPVNTLLFPDGQVVYRVEWAMIRGEVNRMQKSFGIGTPFRIAGVDLKDDRLELKLTARSGDSGRLKVMLGAGWQARMTNASVVQVLGKALRLPSVSSGDQATSVETHLPIATGSRTSGALLYVRPTDTVVIPERIPEADVREILSGLRLREEAANSDLLLSASVFVQAFRAFEDAYSRERTSRPLQDILALRSQLGNELIPHTSAEVAFINRVFSECARTAAIRGAVDNSGRDSGPGSNSPAYQRAFLGKDVGTLQRHSTDQMGATLIKLQIIGDAQKAILEIEKSLDTGKLVVANGDFATMTASRGAQLPEVARYLSQSANLVQDLASYVVTSSNSTRPENSLVQRLHSLQEEQTQLATLTDKPITSAYLRTNIGDDNASLKDKLSTIQAFHFDRKLYLTPIVRAQGQGVDAAAAERIGQLRQLLQSNAELVSLIHDQKGLEFIRTNFGEAISASLYEKGKDISDAESLQAKLENQLTSAQQQQHEQLEQKHAALERRASLANEIITSVLVITKLEEQFQKTEIMGYSMEERKRRSDLSALLASNRAVLDANLWAQVHQNLQQILPGLTVWEANYARLTLGGIHH